MSNVILLCLSIVKKKKYMILNQNLCLFPFDREKRTSYTLYEYKYINRKLFFFEKN